MHTAMDPLVVDDAEIYQYLRHHPILRPADLQAVPGYVNCVDFSVASNRRLNLMYTDYAFSKADEYECGIKACRKKHQHGYVVKSSDHKVTNIGKDCGRKHLGLEFARARKVYEARRKANSNAEYISLVRKEIDHYRAQVEWLEQVGKALVSCSFYFKKNLPKHYARVKEMSRIGSSDLMAPKALKGREAELHFAQTKTRRSDYPGGVPLIDVKIATLNGCSFFRENLGPLIRKEISDPLEAVSNIDDEAIAELSNRALAKFSKDTSEAIRKIGKAEQLVRAGSVFFEEANLSKLKLVDDTEPVMDLVRFSIQHLLPMRR